MIYYFIIGVLFIDIIIPILEKLANCIITRLEVYNTQCALKITEINNDIENIANPPESYRSIGFCMPDKEQCDD